MYHSAVTSSNTDMALYRVPGQAFQSLSVGVHPDPGVAPTPATPPTPRPEQPVDPEPEPEPEPKPAPVQDPQQETAEDAPQKRSEEQPQPQEDLPLPDDDAPDSDGESSDTQSLPVENKSEKPTRTVYTVSQDPTRKPLLDQWVTKSTQCGYNIVQKDVDDNESDASDADVVVALPELGKRRITKALSWIKSISSKVQDRNPRCDLLVFIDQNFDWNVGRPLLHKSWHRVYTCLATDIDDTLADVTESKLYCNILSQLPILRICVIDETGQYNKLLKHISSSTACRDGRASLEVVGTHIAGNQDNLLVVLPTNGTMDQMHWFRARQQWEKSLTAFQIDNTADVIIVAIGLEDTPTLPHYTAAYTKTRVVPFADEDSSIESKTNRELLRAIEDSAKRLSGKSSVRLVIINNDKLPTQLRSWILESELYRSGIVSVVLCPDSRPVAKMDPDHSIYIMPIGPTPKARISSRTDSQWKSKLEKLGIPGKARVVLLATHTKAKVGKVNQPAPSMDTKRAYPTACIYPFRNVDTNTVDVVNHSLLAHLSNQCEQLLRE